MTEREAIERIQNDLKLHHDDLSGQYRKALRFAISALEKQEQDSNKCCETCKHRNHTVWERPCNGCYLANDYEDYYEAEDTK
jgi:hypothetical protein